MGTPPGTGTSNQPGTLFLRTWGGAAQLCTAGATSFFYKENLKKCVSPPAPLILRAEISLHTRSPKKEFGASTWKLSAPGSTCRLHPSPEAAPRATRGTEDRGPHRLAARGGAGSEVRRARRSRPALVGPGGRGGGPRSAARGCTESGVCAVGWGDPGAECPPACPSRPCPPDLVGAGGGECGNRGPRSWQQCAGRRSPRTRVPHLRAGSSLCDPCDLLLTAPRYRPGTAVA